MSMRRWALLAWIGVYVFCCAPGITGPSALSEVRADVGGTQAVEAGNALQEETGEATSLHSDEGSSPEADGVKVKAVAEGKSAADFGGQTVLIVHYRRDAADYTGWNVWAWPINAEGAAYPLTESDAFGLYTVVVLDEAHSKLGFLVRRGDWEEKDGAQDRMIEIGPGGIAEVWAREGRLAFDTTPPTVDAAQDAKPAAVNPGMNPGAEGFISRRLRMRWVRAPSRCCTIIVPMHSTMTGTSGPGRTGRTARHTRLTRPTGTACMLRSSLPTRQIV